MPRLPLDFVGHVEKPPLYRCAHHRTMHGLFISLEILPIAFTAHTNLISIDSVIRGRFPLLRENLLNAVSDGTRA
jgi:hypothetical protein